jgi:hypothetical protein
MKGKITFQVTPQMQFGIWTDIFQIFYGYDQLVLTQMAEMPQHMFTLN